MKHSLRYYKQIRDTLKSSIEAKNNTIPASKQDIVSKYLKHEHKRMEDHMQSIKDRKIQSTYKGRT